MQSFLIVNKKIGEQAPRGFTQGVIVRPIGGEAHYSLHQMGMAVLD
jgi:hypothetical protein